MTPIQIIATIGPASHDKTIIGAMIDNGMSLARLNFSWGTHAEHRAYIDTIRTVAADRGVHIPIIQDLSGPRIATGASHGFDKTLPVLTEKDRADLVVAIDLQLEYVALSFVSQAADVLALKEELAKRGSAAKVIAKIERAEAVAAINDIVAVADGIMVARGDLGEAVPMETLPFVKKDILDCCVKAGVPAIVATEMLTSMIDDTDPSRADISDIAHAVLDGTSATMLSNETAVGSFPAETVAVMRRVVDEAVKHVSVPVQSRF